jgi:hypothetical protein
MGYVRLHAHDRTSCAGWDEATPTTMAAVLDFAPGAEANLLPCSVCALGNRRLGELECALFDLDVLARRVQLCAQTRHVLEMANTDGQLAGAPAVNALTLLRRCVEFVIAEEHLAEWTTSLTTKTMTRWWTEQSAAFTQVADAARARVRGTQTGWDGPLRLLTPSPAFIPSRDGDQVVWWNAAGPLLDYTAVADIEAVTTCSDVEPRPVFVVPAHVAANAPAPWLDLGPAGTDHANRTLIAAYSAFADTVETLDQGAADAVVFAARTLQDPAWT